MQPCKAKAFTYFWGSSMSSLHSSFPLSVSILTATLPRSPSQRGQEGFQSLTPSCVDCHDGEPDVPINKSFQQLTQTTSILSSNEACFPLKIGTSSHQFG